MNLLDWVLIGIIAFSVVAAALQGFVYAMWMMAATLAAVGAAVWEYPRVMPWLTALHSPEARSLAAMALILAAVLVVAMVLGRIVRGVVHAVGLGGLDRLLGAALGLVRGVILAIAVVFVLTAFPVQRKWLEGSRLAPRLLWGGHVLAAMAPPDLAQRFTTNLVPQIQSHLSGVVKWQ